MLVSNKDQFLLKTYSRVIQEVRSCPNNYLNHWQRWSAVGHSSSQRNVSPYFEMFDERHDTSLFQYNECQMNYVQWSIERNSFDTHHMNGKLPIPVSSSSGKNWIQTFHSTVSVILQGDGEEPDAKFSILKVIHPGPSPSSSSLMRFIVFVHREKF